MDYHSAPRRSTPCVGEVSQSRQRHAIADVRLPPESMYVGSDGVTYFGVDVSLGGHWASWRIFKRYTHFANLHSFLQELGPSCAFPFAGAPFPKKHLSRCEGWKLEARRRALETWLQSALQANFASWLGPLRVFLRCDQGERGITRRIVPASEEVPSVAVLQSAVSSPTAPGIYRVCQDSNVGFIGEGPRCSFDRQHALELAIQIPVGVSPGQNIIVKMPDGVDVTCRLPESTREMTSLNLLYDPISRSVVVLNA